MSSVVTLHRRFGGRSGPSKYTRTLSDPADVCSDTETLYPHYHYRLTPSLVHVLHAPERRTPDPGPEEDRVSR